MAVIIDGARTIITGHGAGCAGEPLTVRREAAVIYTQDHSCKNESLYGDQDGFVCSECGINLCGWKRIVHDQHGEATNQEYAFKHCPECGRRVV